MEEAENSEQGVANLVSVEAIPDLEETKVVEERARVVQERVQAGEELRVQAEEELRAQAKPVQGEVILGQAEVEILLEEEVEKPQNTYSSPRFRTNNLESEIQHMNTREAPS